MCVIKTVSSSVKAVFSPVSISSVEAVTSVKAVISISVLLCKSGERGYIVLSVCPMVSSFSHRPQPKPNAKELVEFSEISSPRVSSRIATLGVSRRHCETSTPKTNRMR